ncbi:MAG: EthD domain-containing protein, partial [Caulobacteraceae bacterium]
MIKLTFALVRLPSLSREAFQRYWFETHAPLVASVKDALRIRRYVQLHSLPADVSEP